MTLLALAAAAALALPGGEGDVLSGLPRSLAQAEQPQPRPQEPSAPAGSGAAHDFFEFGRVQAAAHVGFIAFSEDFESDPQFVGGIGARVDWPWLSQDVFGFDKDRIGLFADLSFSRIDRDLDFLDENDGLLIFFTFGGDINVYEDETWCFRGQAGLQYGHFGGVDETDNGVAGILGIDAGVKVAENMSIIFNPQAAFGHAGDQIYFINFAFQYRF